MIYVRFQMTISLLLRILNLIFTNSRLIQMVQELIFTTCKITNIFRNSQIRINVIQIIIVFLLHLLCLTKHHARNQLTRNYQKSLLTSLIM
uniref:Putative secreted protein n=1 Tax=Xenopsylla cheopis TaxID=163159 RepID=A0A6M2DVE0_XENCH